MIASVRSGGDVVSGPRHNPPGLSRLQRHNPDISPRSTQSSTLRLRPEGRFCDATACEHRGFLRCAPATRRSSSQYRGLRTFPRSTL